jgi:hypothetical protein
MNSLSTGLGELRAWAWSSWIRDVCAKLSTQPSVTRGSPRNSKPSASYLRDGFLTFPDEVKSSAKPEYVVVSSTCMPSWLTTRRLRFTYAVPTTRPSRGVTYRLPRSSCQRTRVGAARRRGSGIGIAYRKWWLVQEWLHVELYLAVLLLHKQLILLTLSITWIYMFGCC